MKQPQLLSKPAGILTEDSNCLIFIMEILTLQNGVFTTSTQPTICPQLHIFAGSIC